MIQRSSINSYLNTCSIIILSLVNHLGEQISKNGWRLRASFPDLRGTVEDVLLAEDGRLMGRVTWHGTQQGMFLGLPPTHKAVAFAVIHILRFDAGQIVEWWGVADVFGALVQLGGKVVADKSSVGYNC